MTGKQVRTIRKRFGLTQQELAEKIGVTRNTITRWELGLMGIRPSTARLLQLLAAHAEGQLDGKDRKASQTRLRRY